MSRAPFIPLSKALETTLEKLGLEGGWASAVIHRVWSQVVGEEIARRTEPGLVRGGRLQVTVGDSVWLQQLTMLKPMILEGLQSYVGSRGVRDVFFTLGAPASSRAQSATGAEARSALPTPEMEERLAEVLTPVQDLECREVLARILKKAWKSG